jgi:NAD+ diphosphatase
MFISAVVPPEENAGISLYFLFQKHRLLVISSDKSFATIPDQENIEDMNLTPLRLQYVGSFDDQFCYTGELEDGIVAPEGYRFVGLRNLYGVLPDELFQAAMRMVQLVAWARNNQFCGHCATPMQNSATERVKRCPNCGLTRYPRISPAVIMAVVKDGDKLMMARSHRYPPGWYSVLAGFVEPGETAEEAVAREVKEEVGIEVTDIQYFGSQPWPFPDSLMLGFTAKYAGGEIVLEEAEIEDAKWMTAQEMPASIPTNISISRRLIDWFVANH